MFTRNLYASGVLVGWAGRRAVELCDRRDPRRHLRLLRGHRRRGDPAPHRVPHCPADHPGLDGTGSGSPARLGVCEDLLRYYHHPVHRRLDRAGAGGAASYSSFARRTSSWPRAWPVPAKAASSPCTCCHRSSPKTPSAAEGFTAEEAGAQVTLGHTGRAREVSADA